MAWRPQYKQLCAICRKNHVLIKQRNQFPICQQCSMREISKPIEDETFKKLFDIDQKLYEQSSFLRSIKSSYLKFGSLSDKQIETFKKVADEMANPKADNLTHEAAAPVEDGAKKQNSKIYKHPCSPPSPNGKDALQEERKCRLKEASQKGNTRMGKIPSKGS